MQFPITVDKLMGYLPHRPPMIWIDEILEVTPTSGRAQLTLKSEGLYFNKRGLIPSAPIEWIAQAAGYCAAARALKAPDAPKLSLALLVGIRDAQFGDVSALGPGSVVTVQVDIIRELPPLALIQGRVLKDSKELCRMVLKLFAEGSGYNSGIREIK